MEMAIKYLGHRQHIEGLVNSVICEQNYLVYYEMFWVWGLRPKSSLVTDQS